MFCPSCAFAGSLSAMVLTSQIDVTEAMNHPTHPSWAAAGL